MVAYCATKLAQNRANILDSGHSKLISLVLYTAMSSAPMSKFQPMLITFLDKRELQNAFFTSYSRFICYMLIFVLVK